MERLVAGDLAMVGLSVDNKDGLTSADPPGDTTRCIWTVSCARRIPGDEGKTPFFSETPPLPCERLCCDPSLRPTFLTLSRARGCSRGGSECKSEKALGHTASGTQRMLQAILRAWGGIKVGRESGCDDVTLSVSDHLQQYICHSMLHTRHFSLFLGIALCRNNTRLCVSRRASWRAL